LQKPFRAIAPLFIWVFDNQTRLAGTNRSSDVMVRLNASFLDSSPGDPEDEREAIQG
jgi:hypothetical protein